MNEVFSAKFKMFYSQYVEMGIWSYASERICISHISKQSEQ